MLDKLLDANLDKALPDDVQTLWDLPWGENLLTQTVLFAYQLVGDGYDRGYFELLEDINLLNKIESLFKQDALDVLVDFVEQFLVYLEYTTLLLSYC